MSDATAGPAALPLADRLVRLGRAAARRGADLAVKVLVPDAKRRRLPATGRLGLHLQDRAVALAAVRRMPAGKPLLTYCDWRPLPRQPDPAIQLRQLLVENGLAETLCHWVLDEADYQLLLVDMPDVPPAELREAVRWRVQELLDFPVTEAVIDVFDMPRYSSQARDNSRTLYVAVTRAARIEERVGFLNRGGAQLEVIDIAELALRNVMALVPEDGEGAALLRLEPAHVRILITRGGALFLSRRVPLAPPADGSAPAATPAGVLAQEVTRSLEYYEGRFGQPPVAALYVAPGSVLDDAQQGALAETTGVTPQPLDLNPLLEMRAPLSVDQQARTLLAVGVALRQQEATL